MVSAKRESLEALLKLMAPRDPDEAEDETFLDMILLHTGIKIFFTFQNFIDQDFRKISNVITIMTLLELKGRTKWHIPKYEHHGWGSISSYRDFSRD